MAHARRRWVWGVALAAGASVAALALSTQPLLPSVAALHREPFVVAAVPPATESVAVCGGPILAAGRDAADASALSDAAEERPVLDAQTVESAQRRLDAVDVAAGAGPLVLTVPPVGDQRSDIAAAASAAVEAEDLRGFAAAACVRATMESWIVGGSAMTGASDLVILSNPGAVPARVDITVFGDEGAGEPAAGQDVIVAAGTQRVIPLASLALGQERPVIRVTSAEAPVAASLQSRITRVLVPGGLDQVAATAAPAPQLWIPAIAHTSGAEDATATLRLLSPSADATATVTVHAEAGHAVGPVAVSLTEGVPLELDLGDLGAGRYGVDVIADRPLVGAVRTNSGAGVGSDFGWFAAAEPLTQNTVFAVAEGPAPEVMLRGVDDTAQTVELVEAGGARTSVVVPARGVASVPVVSGGVYQLEVTGSVAAALGYAGPGALAGYVIAPAESAAAQVRVVPR